MEIPENMDQWNVLEKMEQWDTSTTDEDIKILPRIETFYRNLQTEVGESAKAYRLAMEAILQLPGHSNYKLKKVLNDQTGLTKEVKERILEVWEKNHSRYHCWCLPSNDTTLMEECIRTNSAIMYDVNDKDEELTRRYNEFDEFWRSTNGAIKIFSSHQLKRCENAKHEKLKSTSSP